jgi:hypothetical protein
VMSASVPGRSGGVTSVISFMAVQQCGGAEFMSALWYQYRSFPFFAREIFGRAATHEQQRFHA